MKNIFNQVLYLWELSYYISKKPFQSIKKYNNKQFDEYWKDIKFSIVKRLEDGWLQFFIFKYNSFNKTNKFFCIKRSQIEQYQYLHTTFSLFFSFFFSFLLLKLQKMSLVLYHYLLVFLFSHKHNIY